MKSSEIPTILPSLQAANLSLQHLFLYSRGHEGENSFIEQRDLHKQATGLPVNFFEQAQQGLLVTLKTDQLKKNEELDVIKLLDPNIDSPEGWSDIESYLATSLLLTTETSDPDVDFATEIQLEPTQQEIDENKSLLAANQEDLKVSLFSKQLATTTFGYLYQMRRPNYQQLTPQSPIAADDLLYTVTGDWMLNKTPEHTYKRLGTLKTLYEKALYRIAAFKKLSKQQIGEMMILGHFLAAVKSVTDFYSKNRK